ncbi:MAG TPA: hypothetical protein VH040_16425 [Usitatibacter sp.]|nr:hypothetical protein [Usitatibacter sp.]
MASRRVVKKINPRPFTYFEVPKDPEYLQALGLIAIRHAHLDRILQLTIKTLSGVTPQEALKATAYQGSATLRERVLKLARRALGEGPALLRTQAIIQQCAWLTEQRNAYMHSICARELDGDAKLVRPDVSIPLPGAGALRQLAMDLAAATSELDRERSAGFIRQALERSENIPKARARTESTGSA